MTDPPQDLNYRILQAIAALGPKAFAAEIARHIDPALHKTVHNNLLHLRREKPPLVKYARQRAHGYLVVYRLTKLGRATLAEMTKQATPQIRFAKGDIVRLPGWTIDQGAEVLDVREDKAGQQLLLDAKDCQDCMSQVWVWAEGMIKVLPGPTINVEQG